MTKKYMFFDIDGTLTNDNPGGIVTDKTQLALQKLRENGHFLAIATGRAQHFAKGIMDELGFDNMVSDGGNGLTLNGQVLEIVPMDRELAQEVIDECLEKNLNFFLSLDNSPTAFALKGMKVEEGPHLKKIVYLDSLDEVGDIFKIYIDDYEGLEDELTSIHKLGYITTPRIGIIVEPLDKFVGIKKMVEHLGGDLEDVVVFGDGKNDISMMEQAAFSIAMGNAIDEVKDIASFVTKSNKEDGIYYACEHFGWI